MTARCPRMRTALRSARPDDRSCAFEVAREGGGANYSTGPRGGRMPQSPRTDPTDRNPTAGPAAQPGTGRRRRRRRVRRPASIRAGGRGRPGDQRIGRRLRPPGRPGLPRRRQRRRGLRRAPPAAPRIGRAGCDAPRFGRLRNLPPDQGVQRERHRPRRDADRACRTTNTASAASPTARPSTSPSPSTPTNCSKPSPATPAGGTKGRTGTTQPSNANRLVHPKRRGPFPLSRYSGRG